MIKKYLEDINFFEEQCNVQVRKIQYDEEYGNYFNFGNELIDITFMPEKKQIEIYSSSLDKDVEQLLVDGFFDSTPFSIIEDIQKKIDEVLKEANKVYQVILSKYKDYKIVK